MERNTPSSTCRASSSSKALYCLAEIVVIGVAARNVEAAGIVHNLRYGGRPVAEGRHTLHNEGAGAFRQSQRVEQAVEDVQVRQSQSPVPQARNFQRRHRQVQQLHIGQDALGSQEFPAYLGELAGGAVLLLQRRAVEAEHRPAILPSGGQLDVSGVFEVVTHGRGSELRAQADGPGGGIGEAEKLRGQLAAGLAQEELGGFQKRSVKAAVAVAVEKGGDATLQIAPPAEEIAGQIRHTTQPRDGRS